MDTSDTLSVSKESSGDEDACAAVVWKRKWSLAPKISCSVAESRNPHKYKAEQGATVPISDYQQGEATSRCLAEMDS